MLTMITMSDQFLPHSPVEDQMRLFAAISEALRSSSWTRTPSHTQHHITA